MKQNLSKQAFENALNCFPGGVNSPVRAFKSVGLTPLFIKSANKSRITDIDGCEYIDYVCSWGPLILGHADPDVVKAVSNAAQNGLSYGAPTMLETELAELIKEFYPSIEKMRFVSSGTEAAMSAIRLARGITNRELIIKFDGGYHGHADSLLVSAGSGVATFSIPSCAGVTKGTAADTLVVPFNDINALKTCFEKYPNQIACLIGEPICGNMGVVPPKSLYWREVRELCTKNKALLIFDHVMSGFRSAKAMSDKTSLDKEIYEITPDLICLGKIVGGGMPLAVYGGKTEYMAYVSPDGPVYQAGTLSGNPIAVSSGIAALKKIKSQPDFYAKLNKSASALEAGLKEAANEAGVKAVINRYNSMMTLFFTDKPVFDYDSAKTSDTKLFSRWFSGMLNEGIYLPPSQFEAAFVSIAHTQSDIAQTITAAKKVMKSL